MPLQFRRGRPIHNEQHGGIRMASNTFVRRTAPTAASIKSAYGPAPPIWVIVFERDASSFECDSKACRSTRTIKRVPRRHDALGAHAPNGCDLGGGMSARSRFTGENALLQNDNNQTRRALIEVFLMAWRRSCTNVFVSLLRSPNRVLSQGRAIPVFWGTFDV